MGAREELLAAVDAARRQQLLGADNPHEGSLFGADQVLSSLAASRRKIGCSNVSPAREVGDDGGVLVVRMGPQYKQTAERVQALEQALKPSRAAESFLLGLKRGKEQQGQQEAKRVSAAAFSGVDAGASLSVGKVTGAVFLRFGRMAEWDTMRTVRRGGRSGPPLRVPGEECRFGDIGESGPIVSNHRKGRFTS